MNKTKYMQTDSRWGGLGYPKSPWFIRNCGCGEVSIANIIIEMQKYKNYTPATIQPYCKRYAAANGDGTYWSGIPAMMKYYGLTEVKEHATMSPLWKELAKGNRVAIYLMGSRKGGSKGVKWTSGGHFVCSTGYKYENGKHYVYVKDSYSNSSLRNGWISYEENMKGDVLKVWSGKLNGTLYGETATPTKTPTPKKGTYTGAYPNPKSYLEKGDRGTEVTKLQKYLNWSFGGQSGFTKLAEDGIFGDATNKWVKVFQEATLGKGEGDGKVGSKTIAKMKEYGGYKPSAAATAKPPTTTTTKAQQINERALEYAWKIGTPEKTYKYPSGSPNPAFKAAWKKYFPKRKINCGCHQYVMLVLKACGYPTMPLEWKNIFTYMRKNFKELKVNYKQSQLKAGDIRIHKNSSGGYHIWIIVEQNGKFYRAEANQTGNKRYAHINTSNKGNETKHKGDWLFRAK